MWKKQKSMNSSFGLRLRIKVRISVIRHFARDKLRSYLTMIISILFFYHLLNLSCLCVIMLQPWFIGLFYFCHSVGLWLLHFSSWLLPFCLICVSDCMKTWLCKRIFFRRSWPLSSPIFKLNSLFLMKMKFFPGFISKINEFLDTNLLSCLSITILQLFYQWSFC